MSTGPNVAPSDDLHPRRRRDAWTAWALLALTGVLFVAYNGVLLPRLTNVHFGDIEFTGWSGPMGSRLLRGDRPYIDFVLPIPPGSFVLLALLERIFGRPLVLQELALNAVAQLVMGGIAYAMARAVTSRRNAVLTAIAALVTVMQLNKECAYDHTAQVVAWASTAAGLWALVTPNGIRQTRYWTLAGTLAGLTLAFKQSTAIGCIGGWFLALAYLAAVEAWRGERARAAAIRGPVRAYSLGIGLGLASVWLMLLLLGSTAKAFFQAVFLDGSTLKGGLWLLLRHLIVYLFDFEAYPASLVFIALFVLLGVRLLSKVGGLGIGDEPRRERHYGAWEGPAVAAMVTAGVGAGIYFLCFGRHGYPVEWIGPIDRMKEIPYLALVPACVIFVAHLQSPAPKERSEDVTADPWRAGHVINAALIAGLSCTLMHNTSAPEFRPYYDNNTIIPLSFLCAFVVLDRAELRPLSVLLVALMIVGAGGNKYYRALRATTPIGHEGYWAGMRVTPHGSEIARVASRVRALTAPADTVLVLPEDLEVETLIGRPRPPLLGAIVFVDQYAPRLAVNDISRLDENPPRVIVIHPRQERSWQRFFRIWSGQSGAERVLLHVLHQLIPARYERDSSYDTTFLWQPETLDVYVLRDGLPRAANPGQETPR